MRQADVQHSNAANLHASPLPKVIEAYSGYAPPFDVTRSVEQMIASVPSKYLVGLSEIILTNIGGLSRKMRKAATKSRGKKVKIARARGRYHPDWNNQPAWIEIFVDNTLRNWERGWWLKIRYLRESLIGDVLFHEIGHHIHFAVRPEYREREDVADVWKARLSRNYSRRAYRLLRALAKAFHFVSGPFLDFIVRRSLEVELKRGMISRAEYDERKRKPKEL
jgi:hypothetical protein